MITPKKNKRPNTNRSTTTNHIGGTPRRSEGLITNVITVGIDANVIKIPDSIETDGRTAVYSRIVRG